jgi:hypothetical protein
MEDCEKPAGEGDPPTSATTEARPNIAASENPPPWNGRKQNRASGEVVNIPYLPARGRFPLLAGRSAHHGTASAPICLAALHGSTDTCTGIGSPVRRRADETGEVVVEGQRLDLTNIAFPNPHRADLLLLCGTPGSCDCTVLCEATVPDCTPATPGFQWQLFASTLLRRTRKKRFLPAATTPRRPPLRTPRRPHAIAGRGASMTICVVVLTRRWTGNTSVLDTVGVRPGATHTLHHTQVDPVHFGSFLECVK